jgi:hypothetical protein
VPEWALHGGHRQGRLPTYPRELGGLRAVAAGRARPHHRAGAKLFFLSREEFRSLAEGDARVGKVIYLNLLHFLITRLRAKDEELDLFMMGSL